MGITLFKIIIVPEGPVILRKDFILYGSCFIVYQGYLELLALEFVLDWGEDDIDLDWLDIGGEVHRKKR